MRALMEADSTPTRQQAGGVSRLTRLDTAKEVILDFVGRRRNDRIGVVVFGRTAYILSPPTLDKTLLTLHFTLPLEKPLDPKVHEVAVDVYDPSFFVAFGFATEAPVKIAGTPTPGCTVEIQKPDPESEANAKALSEAFFSQLGPNSNFGSQFAQTAVVKCTAH